jgi:hypothetical protein
VKTTTRQTKIKTTTIAKVGPFLSLPTTTKQFDARSGTLIKLELVSRSKKIAPNPHPKNRPQTSKVGPKLVPHVAPIAKKTGENKNAETVNALSPNPPFQCKIPRPSLLQNNHK